MIEIDDQKWESSKMRNCLANFCSDCLEIVNCCDDDHDDDDQYVEYVVKCVDWLKQHVCVFEAALPSLLSYEEPHSSMYRVFFIYFTLVCE